METAIALHLAIEKKDINPIRDILHSIKTSERCNILQQQINTVNAIELVILNIFSCILILKINYF